MFCSKCGTQNEDNYSFCKKCGAELKDSKGRDGVGDSSSNPRTAGVFNPSSSNPFALTSQPSSPAQSVPTPAAAIPDSSASISEAQDEKKKRIILFSVGALLIVAAIIVLICFFLTGSKPCYVLKQRTSAGQKSSVTTSYDRNDNGVVLSTTTIRDGKTEVTDFKELAAGMVIMSNETGKYDTDSDGYITKMEVKDSSGKVKYTRTYEYYRPGIIKHTYEESSDGSSASSTYDEDGWLIQLTTVNKNGDKNDVKYSYTESNNGKTMVRNIDSGGSSNEAVYVYDIDENGNIVAKYDRNNPSVRTTNIYEKVEAPDKMISASARLKG